MRVAYENALGKSRVFTLYSPQMVKVFSDGGCISLPGNPSVIHGHYKPHPNHLALAREVKRAVWLRDPVMRAWSLLHHMVAVQKQRQEYAILRDNFGDKVNKPDEEIFEFFLTHPKLKKLNEPYQNYFHLVKPEEFDFVGLTEQYESDLVKLSSQMGVSLEHKVKNVRAKKVAIKREDFRQYLEKEYSIVSDYIQY